MSTNEGVFEKHSIENPIFMNSFGIIYLDRIIIRTFNKDTSINLGEIRKVMLIKKREIRYNVLSFVVSIVVLLTAIIYNNNNVLCVSISLLITFFLIIFSFFYKKNKYALVFLKHTGYFKIQVNKERKKEAKILMRKINAKVNPKTNKRRG